MLDIRLLGPPLITLDGNPVKVDTRKAIALLAFLAIEGGVSRETVAALFWGESSDERAKATLRRTLSSLRGGIGSEAILADRHHIELSSGDSDVSQFESAIGETFDHDHDPADVCGSCIAPLTKATGLYRGDFLQGFSIRDSPEFEDWERTVSESLRLRAGDAFNRLAMARAAAGDYSGAISSVSRWIELDPLHEPAHRLLMLLNGWGGDRPGAVEAYRSFVSILDIELGVPPLEETTELYEAILDEDLPPAPGVRRRVKAERHPSTTDRKGLIGRDDELSSLRLATGGRGAVIMLSGASWMGKTRLLEEVSNEAITEGKRVFTGRAFRMEESLPYGVATQLLQQLSPLIDTDSNGVPDWAKEEAARIDPRIGPTPADQESGGELRLFEGVAALFEHVARRNPLLIAVDDLQWVDPASARLISYLGRRIGHLDVNMILSVRSNEPLSESVRDLLDLASQSIDLYPLEEDSISDLAESPTQAHKVIRSTGGVPLLVLEELAGGALDSGGIARYMEHRLDSVGQLSRQVLAAASVLTGICDSTLLRDTSGRSDDEIVEAVEELVAAGLLREIPDSDGLGFTLDRLENFVYENTSLIRRRLLHRRAANALESRPRARSDARLAAVIAAQHRGAGDQEAAKWYRTAGDLAADIFANDEARTFYETAIALGAPDIGSIRLALGEIALNVGDYSSAVEAFNAAAGQSKSVPPAVVEHRLGVVNRLLGRFDTAETHFETSARLDPGSAALFADWALLHHRLKRTDAARGAASKALENARVGEDSRGEARALNILSVVEPDRDLAMEFIGQAIDLVGEDDVLRMDALNNRGRVLADSGDLDAAITAIEEAIDIAGRTGFRHREAALRNRLADLHHLAGHDELAKIALTDAVTLFADIDAGSWEPELWLLSQW
ncbi:MAG: AAA family ATPase [Acidimicrobiia bacterium]